MGMPVTLDNTKELAQDQADAMGKKLNAQIDHNLEQYKKNYQAWSKTFLEAEQQRRKEEHSWRAYYEKVYNTERTWWQDVAWYALVGIQLWALTRQYLQQKEIADRTYDLANRQQNIAEQLYAYYQKQYQPHEVALGKSIDTYFAKPYQPQYDTTGGRFAINARLQMAGKRKEVLVCASQFCTGALRFALNDVALTEATLVGNAINSAVKYENSRESKMFDKWMQARLNFIGFGRGVSQQSISGIDNAVNAFSSFGADPGAALSQLLNTIAYTVGGIIPKPEQPRAVYGNGTSDPYAYRIANGRPQYSRSY